MAHSHTDDPAASRSTGLPPSMGKATEVLKTRVPDEVKDDFLRLAHSLGMDESGLLRMLVLIRLYGVDMVSRMHAERLAIVAGAGPIEGRDREVVR